MQEERLWCQYCGKVVTRSYLMDGMKCCTFCGRVVGEDIYSEEPTFVKDSSGQSKWQGTLKKLDGDILASRERTVARAREDMDWMLLSVSNEEHKDTVSTAINFYRIALDRNFTRGRERELVLAACLYLACRSNKRPFLLIDFAEYLGRNVYVLGAVYLLLVKLLSLIEHPDIQNPIDPSFFIHRFVNKLMGTDDKEVSATALKIIASMKRDWMQTGRKPSGLCGAAVYISALSHGHTYSKSQIVRIVHICEATLTKRLIEFENTESGSLTITELTNIANELEEKRKNISIRDAEKQSATGSKVSQESELLCSHKSEPAFAHGLCTDCYKEFIELSGGLDGVSEPPAFQHAQQQRMREENAKGSADISRHDTMACERQNSHISLNFGKELRETSRDENLQFTEGETTETVTEHVSIGDGDFDKLHGIGVASEKACDESETLSDIDDIEVDGYIHNEEEKNYKKIIWEELNREYIEEQEAKAAAAAAAKEANLRNCPEGMEAAQELSAAAAAAVAKARKERQQKRAAEARNSGPVKTAAEATRQMLAKKRLDSKINLAALEGLFEEPTVVPKKPKINRTDDDEKENESEDREKDLKSESKVENEDETGSPAAGYTEDLDYANEEGGYDYNDDYGYEEEY